MISLSADARDIKSIVKGTGTIVPVLNELSTMPWRHIGGVGYRSTILDLGTIWRWLVSFKPRSLYRRGRALSTHWTGWAPEPIWKLWRENLALAENRTQTVQPVTILTALSRLLYSHEPYIINPPTTVTNQNQIRSLNWITIQDTILANILCFLLCTLFTENTNFQTRGLN
jgi:hypothetical protein